MDEKERRPKKGPDTSAKTWNGTEQTNEGKQPMEDTRESFKGTETTSNQNVEQNNMDEQLLDDESNLIPGQRNSDQVENKQLDDRTGIEQTAVGEDRNLKQHTHISSSGGGEGRGGTARDVILENRQLKSQLVSLKTEYKQVRQRYEKLKQRLRSERKVIRKYRRLLIGAFETNSLPVFREESSGDPQSLSLPSDSPMEESNSEKRVANIDDHILGEAPRVDEQLEERENELDYFENRIEYDQSPDSSLHDFQEERYGRKTEKGTNVGSSFASAAAASASQGPAATATAAATAVASYSVEPGSNEKLGKNKRKRDFVPSKDSSWSSEFQSSSSTLSKDGLDMEQVEEEQPKEEDPTMNMEGDNSRSSYAGNESVESRRGRHSIWKPEEERLFDEGFHRYGCRWKLIQENLLPQKSRQQIQSHGTYLLRQGRLRKHQAGRHKRSIRDRPERNDKSTVNKANVESSRPVRQYDVENTV